MHAVGGGYLQHTGGRHQGAEEPVAKPGGKHTKAEPCGPATAGRSNSRTNRRAGGAVSFRIFAAAILLLSDG